MRILKIAARDAGPEMLGAVLCVDVAPQDGGATIKKGQRLAPEHLPVLSALGTREITLVLPDADDLHQDDAGRELATELAGPGIEIRGPVAGQMSLRAAHAGLLRVDVATLERINELDRVAVFTLFDNQLVEAGQEVAAAKLTSLVVPRRPVARAVALARIAGGVVAVRALSARRFGILVSERLAERARERFRANVSRKLRAFGCTAVTFVEATASSAAVQAALRELRAGGAEIVLAAGGSWSNPAEPLFEALAAAGIGLERHGLPADPGTYLWIAYDGDRPMLGLPACALLAESTIADLLIAKVLAGERLTRAELAAFGHGGLLTKETAFRLPRFGEAGKPG